MKTFLVALFLFAVVIGFVIWNAVDLARTFRELLSLVDALPAESADFVKNSENDRTVERLTALWERKFPRIALTSGYENLTRADEAIGSIRAHYRNDNASDFTHARLMAWDSLNRMKLFESFQLDGIF